MANSPASSTDDIIEISAEESKIISPKKFKRSNFY